MKMKTFGYAAIVAIAAVALSIGSATTSEAKGKKKMAAAAPAPVMATCFGTGEAPVCGTRGKLKFTYINSCYASKDGAKVTSQGACAGKAAKGKGGKKKKAMKASKKKASKKM